MDVPRVDRVLRLSRWIRPALFVLLVLLVPQALVAQEEPDPQDPPELPEVVSGYELPRIECFAEIFIEIDEVRDELHQDIARFHDEGRRLEAREKADARLAAVFEEREIDPEAYEEFVLHLALDENLRDVFEQVVQRLQEPNTEGE